MKNLALYNAEQVRRLTGKVLDVDRSHFSKSHPMTIVLSNDLEQNKPNPEPSNPELDQFFQPSDSHSLSPKSQALLDDMFSS